MDAWWHRHPAIRAQKVSAGSSVGMKVLKEAHLFDDWEITPRDYDMYLKRFARCGCVELVRIDGCGSALQVWVKLVKMAAEGPITHFFPYMLFCSDPSGPGA